MRGTDIIVLSALAFVAIAGLSALSRIPLAYGLLALGGFWVATLIFLKLSRAFRTQRIAEPAGQTDFLSGTRFAAMLTDALPQAIAVLDRDGRVLHANPMAQSLVGIDLPGRPLSVYVRDSGITDRLATALAGYTPEPLMVHREVPTESYISLLFSAVTPADDGSGRMIVLVVMNDVTELVLGGQRRADFLANASHELKTPLASMLGYIETLRGHARDDPEAQQRFLAIMEQQAQRMQRLINDLLSLRRIEQSEHIAPTETADLDLSIRAAIESVAPLAEARNVKLKYKKKKRAIAPGHQDETIQLCLNLIENATKLSPDGSTVHITLSAFDQWKPGIPFADGRLPDSAMTREINPAPTSPLPIYTITISDTGPGFSREHLPRIGERFYRVAGDLSSKEKGTGLGLAIVKHIARRHRAGLYVRSEPGTGTEFCIIYTKSSDVSEPPQMSDANIASTSG
ncbi:ATP-binding protein [Algimonas porphyrae]|nr:ATP-binding protein [Algimonas porphyrae]